MTDSSTIKLITRISIGSWKGTKLDNDKFWRKIFKRKSRRHDVIQTAIHETNHIKARASAGKMLGHKYQV